MALPLNIDDLVHQRKVESARIKYKKDWNPEKVLHSVCACGERPRRAGHLRPRARYARTRNRRPPLLKARDQKQ